MIDWEGRRYDHIQELDLENGIISLGNAAGGSYFTKLAISALDYRKGNPTEYSLTYESKSGISTFIITDDWGTFFVLEIEETPEDMPFIEKNKKLCDAET